MHLDLLCCCCLKKSCFSHSAYWLPKASGLVLDRSPLLTSHKWRELVPSGRLVCRYHDVFLWCYVCFVLLRFRLYAFVGAATLRSIVLRYASAPIATHVSFSFFGDVAFSEYFFVPFPLCLCMDYTIEYVARSFLPNCVFLPCDHGLDF